MRLILLSLLVALLGNVGCSGNSTSSEADQSHDTVLDQVQGPDLRDQSDQTQQVEDQADAEPDIDQPDEIQLPDYNSPIPPPTTLKQLIVGMVPITKQPKATKPDWGKTQLSTGESYLFRDDLKAEEMADKDPKGPETSLLYFVQVTDMQLIDEESPLRDVNFDEVLTVAWRPQEMYSVHMFEMTVRTLNRLALHYRPFDLLLFTGDNINNNQVNEHRWFIDILEGNTVDPDSGNDDDPVPGPDNDAHDPFKPEGLYPNLPWYTVYGNHDGLVSGVISAVWPNGVLGVGFFDLAAPDDNCGNCYDFSLSPKDQQFELENDARYKVAIGNWSKALITPTADAPDFEDIRLNEGSTPADFERRPMIKQTWLKMLFDTKTIPDGHGFTQQNLDNDTAWWSTVPVPSLPVRIIALNTTANSVPDGSSEGSMTRKQFDEFLIPELKKAQAENNLVIVTSHHPIKSLGDPDNFGPDDPKDVSAKELRALLHDYPNVILFVTAHSHKHEITPYPAPQGKTPDHGFWEIQTSAVIDYPNQSRVLEIIDARDGTGWIVSTVFDFMSDGSWVSKQAERGRFWSIYDIQNGKRGSGSRGLDGDRNVLLRFAIPPKVRERIDAGLTAGTIPTRGVVSYRFIGWPNP